MKPSLILAFVFSIAIPELYAQEIITITGKVLDAKTKLPLVNAGVGLKNHPYGTYTDHEGKFGLEFPEAAYDDSLFVSYVGYKVLKNRLPGSPLIDGLYLLEESATVLDEVTILAQSLDKFEIKKVESKLRQIKGGLYAFDMELTNKEYNQFLSYLIQSNQRALYEKYKPDYLKYEGSLLTFFKSYHSQQAEVSNKKYILTYDHYPVVNISHEAAMAYCDWLTQQYNSSNKKKFKQATFRLPQLKEWQIAALGYSRFQSWVLNENEVEIRIPDRPGEMLGRRKKMIPFKGSDIRYPWFAAYEYRNKAQNSKNCWMGNFKVPEGTVSCYVYRPDGDGFSYIGKCGSYFPNDMGLFDVVGNIAEMTAEKGKACGGSWNHDPDESTITSMMNYVGSNGAVGLRVFMEIASDR